MDFIARAANTLMERAPRLFDSLAMVITAVASPLGLMSDEDVHLLAENWAENAAGRLSASDPIG